MGEAKHKQDADNWIYEDQTLGTFTVKDGEPDWTGITREDMEAALVETVAWEKDEAAALPLPRLRAVCLGLMEGRYEEERIGAAEEAQWVRDNDPDWRY